jgi:hypothetical protein
MTYQPALSKARRELANTIALQATAIADGNVSGEAAMVALLKSNIELLAAWTLTPDGERQARRAASRECGQPFTTDGNTPSICTGEQDHNSNGDCPHQSADGFEGPNANDEKEQAND